MVFSTTSKYPVSNSKNVVSLIEMRTLPFMFWINWQKKLNTWEPKVAKFKHTRNENCQNFTHQNKTTLFWRKKAKISRFTVLDPTKWLEMGPSLEYSMKVFFHIGHWDRNVKSLETINQRNYSGFEPIFLWQFLDNF